MSLRRDLTGAGAPPPTHARYPRQAKYKDPKRRPQRHDMVHVEVRKRHFPPVSPSLLPARIIRSAPTPTRFCTISPQVFLGGETGEETVGSVSWQSVRARDGRCGVQRFPSYVQLETGTWTLVKMWFCKIDTWLMGECRSHCEQHAWCDVEPVNGGARSIFKCEGDGDGDESDGDC